MKAMKVLILVFTGSLLIITAARECGWVFHRGAPDGGPADVARTAPSEAYASASVPIKAVPVRSNPEALGDVKAELELLGDADLQAVVDESDRRIREDQLIERASRGELSSNDLGVLKSALGRKSMARAILIRRRLRDLEEKI